MLGVRFERKCFFLYSNFRSTTQLYKYMKDLLGGVRGSTAPLDPHPPPAPPLALRHDQSISQEKGPQPYTQQAFNFITSYFKFESISINLLI